MAGRRDRSPSPTRERVLRAADRLWSERGVRGASLDDIARAAEVTKPTVYYYFGDKSALYTEVICSILEEYGEPLRAASRRGARSRDRLAAAVAYLVSAKCSAPLQQVLDEGVRAGELRPIDTAFATQALFNLVDPWTARDPLPGGRDADQLAAEIVGVVVDGLRA